VIVAHRLFVINTHEFLRFECDRIRESPETSRAQNSLSRELLAAPRDAHVGATTDGNCQPLKRVLGWRSGGAAEALGRIPGALGRRWERCALSV